MTLNCNGKILDLKIPKVMGILNLTPDSFYDGGKYQSIKLAINKCDQMLSQGADIIDLGAESTRSGFTDIDEDVQINTLLPVVDFINDNHKIPISIDTRSSLVAKEALNAGAVIINDVSYIENINTLRQILIKWKEETGDTSPKDITKDWYERRPGPKNSLTKNKKDLPIGGEYRLTTEYHGKRGELAGASKDATEINKKGPF